VKSTETEFIIVFVCTHSSTALHAQPWWTAAINLKHQVQSLYGLAVNWYLAKWVKQHWKNNLNKWHRQNRRERTGCIHTRVSASRKTHLEYCVRRQQCSFVNITPSSGRESSCRLTLSSRCLHCRVFPSEMTYIVSSGALNSTHSLTHSLSSMLTTVTRSNTDCRQALHHSCKAQTKHSMCLARHCRSHNKVSSRVLRTSLQHSSDTRTFWWQKPTTHTSCTGTNSAQAFSTFLHSTL